MRRFLPDEKTFQKSLAFLLLDAKDTAVMHLHSEFFIQHLFNISLEKSFAAIEKMLTGLITF